MNDPFIIYRPLLDLIGYTEGTDPSPRRPNARGYNETLAYGAYTGGPVDLVSMTLDQVDKLQTKMLRHPDNKLKSSAVGRYQIIRTTMREIRKVLGLSGKELFNAAMQDRMACFLLGRRGIDKWIAGKMSDAAMLTALSKEWASLPGPDGKGAYDGQHAAVAPKKVLAVLAEVKRRAIEKATQKPASTQTPSPTPSGAAKPYNGAPVPVPESNSADPVIVEKPVVADPGELSTPPAKSKTVWTWALAGIGSIVASAGDFMGGLDWRVQLAITGATVGFAIYGIKRRNDLFKAVRALKAELGG